MNINLVNNASEKRYEAFVDGSTARIEYIKALDKIYLTHTEVPTELEGKGIASALVLKDLERKELTLIPLCPFVALYLKRRPEWKN